MTEGQQHLEAFIKKLLDQQDKELDRLPDKEALRSLAKDMDISEEEWDAFLKSGEDHFTRGQGFYQISNFEDAVKELEQSFVVDPHNLRYSEKLAEVYASWYKESKKPQHFTQANKFARHCLKLDPSNTLALTVISDMKSAQRKTSAIPLLFGLVIGGFLGYFLISYFFSDKNTKQAPNIMEETSIPGQAQEAEIFEGIQSLPLDIPVRFSEGSPLEGLEVKFLSSQKKVFANASSYTLKGYVFNKQWQIRELVLKMKLLDANNQPLDEKPIYLLSKNSHPILPGDLLALTGVAYKKMEEGPLGEIASVELSFDKVQSNEMTAPVEEGKTLDVSWNTGIKPLDLKITERLNVPKTYDNGKNYHKLAWSIENLSSMSLSKLVFTISWTDQKGSLIRSADLYVINSGDPPLIPGFKYVKGGTYELETINLDRPQDYRISIKTVE